jgi:hypothetical protein
MVASTYDILIEQGATFMLSAIWRDAGGSPIDLTGYTARMQVRQKVTSANAELSLTSQAGDITLGDEAGTIVVLVSAGDTAALSIRRGVYDLELESTSGVVTRLLEGVVTVSPEVTR